jgi:hypothetical protein
MSEAAEKAPAITTAYRLAKSLLYLTSKAFVLKRLETKAYENIRYNPDGLNSGRGKTFEGALKSL